MLTNLQERLATVESALERRQGERDLLKQQYETVVHDRETTMAEIELSGQARRLLEIFVKATDVRIRRDIEPLVTEALDFVFSQGLAFHLYSTTRRNQVEYDFIIVRNSAMETEYQRLMSDPDKYADELCELAKETRNINYMYGGAVNQVLGLILRLILVELLKIRGPVLLDEPSSAVGEEYTARLGQLIARLSQRFGRQIILITHSKTLASYAERYYMVDKLGDASRVLADKE
jgi:DNA repair exonuclease SbcCD ATPase subunit